MAIRHDLRSLDMIVAGALLIPIGFIGFAFRQNRNGEQDDKTTEINGQGK